MADRNSRSSYRGSAYGSTGGMKKGSSESSEDSTSSLSSSTTSSDEAAPVPPAPAQSPAGGDAEVPEGNTEVPGDDAEVPVAVDEGDIPQRVVELSRARSPQDGDLSSANYAWNLRDTPHRLQRLAAIRLGSSNDQQEARNNLASQLDNSVEAKDDISASNEPKE